MNIETPIAIRVLSERKAGLSNCFRLLVHFLNLNHYSFKIEEVWFSVQTIF